MKKILALLTLSFVLFGTPASAQMVPGFNGSLVFGSRLPPKMEFLGFLTATGTSATQTWPVDILSETPTRGIVLEIGATRGTASTAAISAASVNGVAAAVVTNGVIDATALRGTGNRVVETLWSAMVPSGAGSVTVSVTANAAISSGGMIVAVYRLTGYNVTTARGVGTTAAANPSASVTSAIGDALVGGIACDGTLASATWGAPMTTDFATASSYSSGSGVSTTTGSYSMSVTTGGSSCAFAGASFKPL